MHPNAMVESAPSHTKGRMTDIIVSPEFLGPRDRVLIIDDFLASGQTIEALARLVADAGARLVGIGAVIEKTFEGGRSILAHWEVPVESLAIIVNMDNGKIVFQE